MKKETILWGCMRDMCKLPKKQLANETRMVFYRSSICACRSLLQGKQDPNQIEQTESQGARKKKIEKRKERK